LELSVDYAKQRVQFDRPIGSFQAVKHRAADMLLEVESLRPAVYYAAWALDRDHPDASLAASMPKAYAREPYRQVAARRRQTTGAYCVARHIHVVRLDGEPPAAGRASLVRCLPRARALQDLDDPAGRLEQRPPVPRHPVPATGHPQPQLVPVELDRALVVAGVEHEPELAPHRGEH